MSEIRLKNLFRRKFTDLGSRQAIVMDFESLALGDEDKVSILFPKSWRFHNVCMCRCQYILLRLLADALTHLIYRWPSTSNEYVHGSQILREIDYHRSALRDKLNLPEAEILKGVISFSSPCVCTGYRPFPVYMYSSLNKAPHLGVRVQEVTDSNEITEVNFLLSELGKS